MFLKKQIKRQLGEILREYRCSHHLTISTISKQSGLNCQQIDTLEIGSLKTWNIYEKLLNCYNKRIKIELIEDRKEITVEKESS